MGVVGDKFRTRCAHGLSSTPLHKILAMPQQGFYEKFTGICIIDVVMKVVLLVFASY